MNPTWLYVGGTYAAAVWLARRGNQPIPPRIAFFFYALVLVFFFQPLTTNTVNVPVDYYEELLPWRDQGPRPNSSNPYLNDVALQMVPWAHEVREQWKSGRIPLWNETAGSGTPLLANSQSGALSLLRLLALPLDLGHAMAAEGAWKVLIALTFTFLFCRRRGYSMAAFDWLGRATTRGLAGNELREWIDLDSLRSDPRFAALATK